jgi:hypothetical protein
MKIRQCCLLVATLAAVICFSRAIDTLAQGAPDGTVVQGGVAQGPAFGTGNGQYPFGRGAGPLPSSGLNAPSRSTATATPTPLPVDASATSDVLHPQQPFATAQCQDGWFSFSQIRDGVCAGHGGVMIWIVQPGDLDGLFYQRGQEASANAARTQTALAAAQAAAAANIAGTVGPSQVAASATPVPSPAAACRNSGGALAYGQASCTQLP